MNRLVDFGLDPEQLAAEVDKTIRTVLGAGSEAVAATTKRLERDLETLTREAVPGRAWRAWRSVSYPRRGGPARHPAGEVFLNGRDRTHGLIDFHTKPGRIKGKAGQWLAIPTKAAGSRGRQRDLTPGEWERQNGVRLRYVYRGGRRSALLVADMGTTNRRTGAFRPITRKRTKADERRGFVRGAQSVVIFVLVPFVAHKNSISIEPLINATPGQLMRELVERVRALP